MEFKLYKIIIMMNLKLKKLSLAVLITISSSSSVCAQTGGATIDPVQQETVYIKGIMFADAKMDFRILANK
jgi:hypothetical protein